MKIVITIVWLFAFLKLMKIYKDDSNAQLGVIIGSSVTYLLALCYA